VRLQRTFLRSKVEKQLFALFLSCAIVPILVLSVLSFDHVTKQLYEQSRTRLHQASKATGMMLLDRLLQAETELDEAIAEGAPFRREDFSSRRFRNVEVVSEGGKRTVWLGEGFELPELPTGDRAHLKAGKTLLHVVYPSGGEPRILLVRPIGPGRSEGRVVAEIDRDYLFDISGENTLPPMAEYCVLDEVDRILACSLGDSGIVKALETDRRVSGQFEWDHEGRRQLAYYWSIFLKPNYHVPQWTVVVSELEAEVLAPIASFRLTFPGAVLLSVFLVTLMCVNQIRRRLVPLKQLRDGTRRIAEHDFDVDVSVDSGDEFQELADSFNAMARRLEQQFDSLAKMIEIDRAILSAIDRDKIVDALIARLRELYPCDSLAVSLVEDGDPVALRTQFSRESGLGSRVVEAEGFTAVEERQLGANSESLLVDVDEEAPHYLEPHERAGMKQCLLLPLFVGTKLSGVVSLGHKRAGGHDAERLVYARQIADQTATALAKVQAIEENRVLAYYDRLTGLPNRLLFKERLEQAVAGASRRGEQVAISVFDIDALKRINDTLGHEVGDHLLRQVADRLSHFLPASGPARTGGDEFGILLSDLTTIHDPALVASRILEAFSEPFFPLADQVVYLTVSVGIAVYPDDGRDSDELLRNADAAMHFAKTQGGNNFQFYTSAMNASAFRRLELENDLRRAIEHDELSMYYQPIVDVETRRPIAAEALMRWHHPSFGLIPPSEFIPIAEEMGIIVELGKWSLQTACAQNRKWQEAGFPPLSMSVNLSSRQLKGEILLQTVRRALNYAGVRAEYLVLELTESMLMDADAVTLKTLHGLKEMGVRLSIDDFGTGYSSLSYLKNFPVDHLKVDRSFLKEITRSKSDAAITKAIIAMAHSLEMLAIAEGVEFEEQMAFLRENGCDAAQGYLISDPIPADGFTKLLKESASREGGGILR
jgi:diguanylate cyclase (GGDEF)-like protein